VPQDNAQLHRVQVARRVRRGYVVDHYVYWWQHVMRCQEPLQPAKVKSLLDCDVGGWNSLNSRHTPAKEMAKEQTFTEGEVSMECFRDGVVEPGRVRTEAPGWYRVRRCQDVCGGQRCENRNVGTVVVTACGQNERDVTMKTKEKAQSAALLLPGVRSTLANRNGDLTATDSRVACPSRWRTRQ